MKIINMKEFKYMILRIGQQTRHIKNALAEELKDDKVLQNLQQPLVTFSNIVKKDLKYIRSYANACDLLLNYGKAYKNPSNSKRFGYFFSNSSKLEKTLPYPPVGFLKI